MTRVKQDRFLKSFVYKVSKNVSSMFTTFLTPWMESRKSHVYSFCYFVS